MPTSNKPMASIRRTTNPAIVQLSQVSYQEPWLEIAPGIACVPCLHYRVEFADAVRRAVVLYQPDAIAVELPPTLAPSLRLAIQHLPALSVLFYLDSEQQPLYLQIEPTDAIVEAVRSGMEKQIPLHFVDIDAGYTHQHDDPVPDAYACLRLGLRAYCEKVMASLRQQPKTPEDRRREQAMAYHLQSLQRQHKRILFVGGMAHIEAITQDLKSPQPMPFSRRHREDIHVFHLHPDSVREIAIETPFLIAVYELRRHALPPEPPPRLPKHRPRFERFELLQGGRPSDPERLYLDALYRAARQAHGPAQPSRKCPVYLLPLDRLFVQEALISEAAHRYQAEIGERVSAEQRAVLRRYAARYAAIEQRLVSDLFQLLTAARFCVDEDFCYEVWDLATRYPWQEHHTAMPMVEVDQAEEIVEDARQRLLARLLKQRRQSERRLPIRPRPVRRSADEWKRYVSGETIFTYPPEDRALASCLQTLQEIALRRLAQERTLIRPFCAGMLDGVDIGETLRHPNEGQVYVRESGRVMGKIASVVLIFENDPETSRYPYKGTWLGESEDAPDRAFYATPPDEKSGGAGVHRCEYGGLLLSAPSGRLFDVWSDIDYRLARSPAEVLLLAALDYAVEPYVLYLAKRPCRSWFHKIAARMGLRILCFSLHEIGPPTRKKIRTFHLLDSIERREHTEDLLEL